MPGDRRRRRSREGEPRANGRMEGGSGGGAARATLDVPLPDSAPLHALERAAADVRPLASMSLLAGGLNREPLTAPNSLRRLMSLSTGDGVY